MSLFDRIKLEALERRAVEAEKRAAAVERELVELHRPEVITHGLRVCKVCRTPVKPREDDERSSRNEQVFAKPEPKAEAA